MNKPPDPKSLDAPWVELVRRMRPQSLTEMVRTARKARFVRKRKSKTDNATAALS